MKKLPNKFRTKLFFIIVTVIAISYCYAHAESEKNTANKFELIRAYMQNWLAKAAADKIEMPSSYLKEKIVDDWDNQKTKYQIVSVRRTQDDNNVGQIPHAINMFWRDILKDENFARLDSKRTLIICCYYGHASSLSNTILGLLGFNSQSLQFGMMDWNTNALVKKPWNQKADYGVETTANTPSETYPQPTIMSTLDDAILIIKERATAYLANASPVIEPPALKAIIDDWEHKQNKYQIVSVTSKNDYDRGHIPHAISISWTDIAKIENLKKLDPKKTIITYSDTGGTGQIASTILNLLGYRATSLMLGMMDWNKSYIDKSRLWDGIANYPVEKQIQQ
jgi:rhodanese-related sulfurtransferase